MQSNVHIVPKSIYLNKSHDSLNTINRFVNSKGTVEVSLHRHCACINELRAHLLTTKFLCFYFWSLLRGNSKDYTICKITVCEAKRVFIYFVFSLKSKTPEKHVLILHNSSRHLPKSMDLHNDKISQFYVYFVKKLLFGHKAV